MGEVIVRERSPHSQFRMLPSSQDVPAPAILVDISWPAADLQLHWASEQIFYRVSVITPYDSPIFICVENGDIPGMRMLLQLDKASIDSVDPYGLGLLYVRYHYPARTS